jgi:C1A family cysteine protease
MKLFNWFRKNKAIETKKFGWKKDSYDERDRKLMFRVVELPKSVDLRPKDTPIQDQGNLGSCTGNSSGANYNFEHINSGKGNFISSRLFIYYNARKIEGTVKEDSGAMLRDCFKTLGTGLQGKGVCSEELWPYNIGRFATKPCKKCYTEASKDRAIEYMRVEQTSMQLKGCLAEGHPFSFGFTVYSNFMNIGSDGIMSMPEGSEEGGHAVMCVGYDDAKQVYIVRNSWGSKWGDHGYFYMPYSYMHDKSLASDFWTIRKVE